MITYIKGDLLQSRAEAIVNTVNTVGVMGKGIAYQFKKAFPHNFQLYKRACDSRELVVGKMLVVRDNNMMIGNKIIINFPTKTDWRKPSEYPYIEQGLDSLIAVIHEYKIKSIAIPPLGAGNGGLHWENVKAMLEQKLSVLTDVEIFIYEPNTVIKEQLKSERVKLTDARAMLLYVLFDLVRNGSLVSEFSSEKVCYFLQRFGAEKQLRLKFEPKFYGPYSGLVRRLLEVLNGSYITGYSDMDKKPFEALMLISDAYAEVEAYINNREDLREITAKTTRFLDGFYSDYTLELLSSVDYIIEQEKTFDALSIQQSLATWSDRKQSLFSNTQYIDLAIQRIRRDFY